jgi:glycosyltransferase involved in cell wall biosynthesis
MKILHVIASVDPAGGGTSWVVLELATAQARAGGQVSIVSEEMPGRAEAIDGLIDELSDRKLVTVHRFSKLSGLSGRLAGAAGAYLRDHIGEYDIAHLHGMWSPICLRASRAARRAGVPYVHAPHGMLEPWAMQQRTMKKKLAMALGFRRILDHAAAVHTTAPQEAVNLRRLGVTSPLAMLVNGVTLPSYDHAAARQFVDATWPTSAGCPRMVFMSRIHPKKGLPNLVEAFKRLEDRYADWHLLIAGPDEAGHQAEVEQLIEQKGMRDRITFTGPVSGQQKFDLLAGCDFFVLPTFSENFGIVVAEALAVGRPAMTTVGAPWGELRDCGCGWWIEIGVDPLAEALDQAMGLSDAERLDMGARGRTLIEHRYTWPAVARQSLDLYAWIVHQAAQPEVVYFPGEPIPEA